MLKKFVVYTIVLLYFLINISCVKRDNESSIDKNLIQFMNLSNGLNIVFVKSYSEKEGCSICQLKWENYNQWKRVSLLYNGNINIIGFYSKEWSDIIGEYSFANFKKLNTELEKKLYGVSSLTLIINDNKIIYKYDGELNLKGYNKIKEISQSRLTGK